MTTTENGSIIISVEILFYGWKVNKKMKENYIFSIEKQKEALQIRLEFFQKLQLAEVDEFQRTPVEQEIQKLMKLFAKFE